MPTEADRIDDLQLALRAAGQNRLYLAKGGEWQWWIGPGNYANGFPLKNVNGLPDFSSNDRYAAVKEQIREELDTHEWVAVDDDIPPTMEWQRRATFQGVPVTKDRLDA